MFQQKQSLCVVSKWKYGGQDFIMQLRISSDYFFFLKHLLDDGFLKLRQKRFNEKFLATNFAWKSSLVVYCFSVTSSKLILNFEALTVDPAMCQSQF